MAHTDSVVSIDPDRLDQEVLNHANLVLEYTEKLADLKYAHARRKAELDLTEARLFLAARQTPSEFDLPEKPTVDAIKAAVLVHDDFQTGTNLLIEAKHDLDLCDAVVSALQHRKSNLGDYVQLTLINWRSDVPVSRGRANEQSDRRVADKVDRHRPDYRK